MSDVTRFGIIILGVYIFYYFSKSACPAYRFLAEKGGRGSR